jgi:hypothetical protein
MRVEDPVKRLGGLCLGLAFLSRWSWREISTENPNFEIASRNWEDLKEELFMKYKDYVNLSNYIKSGFLISF